MAPVYKFSNAGGFTSKQRYTSMLAGNTTWNPWEPQGAYDALSTVTVPTGGVASVTFAGIPQTYKHLEIRGIALTATAGKLLTLQANGDTTSGNYVSHILSGEGTTAKAGAFVSGQTYTRFFGFDVGTSTTNPTAFVTSVLDYTSTVKTKTFRTLAGIDNNGSGEINFCSGLWLNSSTAISSLVIKTQDGTNLAQFSQVTLYGVK